MTTPNFDLISMLIGFGGFRMLEAAAKKAMKPLPRLAVSYLKARVQKAAAAGKLDAATLSLLKAYARATFEWVDEELPLAAGPAKMEAALDSLAAVPYLGAFIRADRAGAKELLQAAYDAIDAEAVEETAELAPKPKTDPPAATAPAAASAPATGSAAPPTAGTP